MEEQQTTNEKQIKVRKRGRPRKYEQQDESNGSIVPYKSKINSDVYSIINEMQLDAPGKYKIGSLNKLLRANLLSQVVYNGRKQYLVEVLLDIINREIVCKKNIDIIKWLIERESGKASATQTNIQINNDCQTVQVYVPEKNPIPELPEG